MVAVTSKLLADSFPDPSQINLISGGAAYSDHIAVILHLANPERYSLTLELPCPFDMRADSFQDTKSYDWRTNPGGTANALHRKFERKCGVPSLSQLASSIAKGATVHVGKGFHDRNTAIANNSQYLIALTYGQGSLVAEGGTADTVRRFARLGNSAQSWHICLPSLDVFTTTQAPAKTVAEPVLIPSLSP